MSSRSFVRWTANVLTALLAAACAEGAPVADNKTTSNGTGGEASTTTTGEGGSGGQTPDPGPEVCPNATGVYEVEPAQTNLLFLLDRSGSMHLRVTDTDTRWTLTSAGLASIVSALPKETVAGLAMFPSGDQPVTCCAITAGNYIDCSACAAGDLPGPESRCDANTYGDLAVSMAAMDPSHASAITAQVAGSDEDFYWGTP